jgi:hypothetical protein
MKSGMVMMLESMGIQVEAVQQLLDPKNVKLLLDKVQRMCDTVDEIKASVLRVEIKLGTLPESVAMNLLADCQSEAFKQAAEFVRDYNGDNGNRSGNNGNNAINGDTCIATVSDGRGL